MKYLSSKFDCARARRDRACSGSMDGSEPYIVIEILKMLTAQSSEVVSSCGECLVRFAALERRFAMEGDNY